MLNHAREGAVSDELQLHHGLISFLFRSYTPEKKRTSFPGTAIHTSMMGLHVINTCCQPCTALFFYIYMVQPERENAPDTMLKTRLTISNRANQKLHLKIRSAEAAETEHCQVRWRKALKLAPGTYFVDCCYPAAHLR